MLPTGLTSQEGMAFEVSFMSVEQKSLVRSSHWRCVLKRRCVLHLLKATSWASCS